MALAKAFPETYQYELNEPTTVRSTFVTFTAIIYNFVGQTCMSMCWTVILKRTVIQAS